MPDYPRQSMKTNMKPGNLAWVKMTDAEQKKLLDRMLDGCLPLGTSRYTAYMVAPSRTLRPDRWVGIETFK